MARRYLNVKVSEIAKIGKMGLRPLTVGEKVVDIQHIADVANMILSNLEFRRKGKTLEVKWEDKWIDGKTVVETCYVEICNSGLYDDLKWSRNKSYDVVRYIWVLSSDD